MRFDGTIPDWAVSLQLQTLPLLLAFRAGFLVYFRSYESLWRYTSMWDLRNLGLGTLCSSLLFFVTIRWGLGLAAYPRSVYIIDALLMILLVGGMRIGPRLSREFAWHRGSRRVLIYGAGDAGEAILRDLRGRPFEGYHPIGFVDDDPTKSGRRIHGVRVLGTSAQLAEIMNKQAPHVVLVAIPEVEPTVLRSLVRALSPYRATIKIIPNLRRLLNGRIELSQVRDLGVEDLLKRKPVDIDKAGIRGHFAGKCVMVTGAGGSIGSELCRQIVACEPTTLVLYERYENNLYAIRNELIHLGYGKSIAAIIGDITDEARLSSVMGHYRPDIVLHAAAHKHVPLMEASPCEAVKNNVGGTRLVSRLADRHKVRQFIMVSTDKAVNPTSVMGATKRVAEMLVQDIGQASQTCFATVRFGNVLGSNGSVVPLFLEQIKAGGPVTVTHPEVRRYFMLISEAVQLVLQAAAQAESGATYILDMGEQIKVVELARNLIRLSGYMPDDEIPITFVGLRPGEKLYEELVGAGETVAPSFVEKIQRVTPGALPDQKELILQVAALERFAHSQDHRSVIESICRLVPTFQPDLVAASTFAIRQPSGQVHTVEEQPWSYK
ncbi:MAG: nucleoside-diphosphate sugar epimerase/dehydratase [Nitrospiraceae bacterium]